MGYQGGRTPTGWPHTVQSGATAGGLRQSLTSEIHPTPLSQEVPSARTKIAWDDPRKLHPIKATAVAC